MFKLICGFCLKEHLNKNIKRRYCKNCRELFEKLEINSANIPYFVKGYNYCLKELTRKSI